MTISSLSSIDIDPPGGTGNDPKRKEFKYDVKLEVGTKPGSGPVQIVVIFHDLVKRMKEAVGTEPLYVLTATDKLFFENKEMSSEEFQEAFKVDKIKGRAYKVMLGFKLRTTTTLYDIKQRLMQSYLIPNDLFMREHVGGFLHGVNYHTYGFLKGDHPDHPDISSLNNRFSRWTNDAWKKLDKNDRNKWKEELPNAFYGDSGVKIPVTFTKERLTAENANQTKITTSALMVSTPSIYGPLLRALLDIAVLGKKINNLIPLALNKENPEGYFHLVAQQELFMELHRNIPISQVPYDATNRPGIQGKLLVDILNSNKDIQRVAYDPKTDRYHVSTQAPKYREVHTWIGKVLHEHKFPYNPTIRPLKYANTNGPATKYSSVFADAMSTAGNSYDESTIKTARSNAWKQRPPLDISYVPTGEAFPPLPKKPVTTSATQSTASETLDGGTIQSAISTALKKMEEKYRSELEIMKQEMQHKMKVMEEQMKDMGKHIVDQTLQALLTAGSPLVTKTDHLQLQQEIGVMSTQLTTLIDMLKGPGMNANASPETITPSAASPPRKNTKRTKPSLTPEKPTNRFEALLTQGTTNASSAASDLDEESEGCEE